MSGVRGTNNVRNWILAKQRDFERELKEIVEYQTGEIELEAIRNAPGPGDEIRTRNGSQKQTDIARGRNWSPINQAIGYRITPDGLRGMVFIEQSAGDIAAWVEFSTGQDAARYLATVDPEWKVLAQKYYINGKGTIIGRPFLYPAYIKHRIEFVKELKELVKKYSSR